MSSDTAVSLSKTKISGRLLLTVFVSTMLPAMYGLQMLSPTAIIEEDDKSSKGDHGSTVLFLAALFSTTFVHNAKIGSRLAMALSSMAFACSGVCGFFTETKTGIYYAGRAFIGFGAGICSNIVPCYLGMISPPKIRGILSSLYSLGLVGGLLAFHIGFSYFKAHYHSIMAAIVIIFTMLPFMFAICLRTRRHSKTVGTVSLRSLLGNPQAKRSLALVALFHLAQNFCGINQLSLNAGSLYQDNLQTHMIRVLLIALCMTFVSGWLLDLFGRKSLVMGSAAITMLCSMAFFFSFHIIPASYVFSLGFNMGLSSIPYVIMGEVFPEEFVPAGAFFGTLWNWGSAAASTLIPQGLPTDRYNPAFLVYAGTSLAFILGVARFFKETKGRASAFQ